MTSIGKRIRLGDRTCELRHDNPEPLICAIEIGASQYAPDPPSFVLTASVTFGTDRVSAGNVSCRLSLGHTMNAGDPGVVVLTLDGRGFAVRANSEYARGAGVPGDITMRRVVKTTEGRATADDQSGAVAIGGEAKLALGFRGTLVRLLMGAPAGDGVGASARVEATGKAARAGRKARAKTNTARIELEETGVFPRVIHVAGAQRWLFVQPFAGKGLFGSYIDQAKADSGLCAVDLDGRALRIEITCAVDPCHVGVEDMRIAGHPPPNDDETQNRVLELLAKRFLRRDGGKFVVARARIKSVPDRG